MKCSCCKKKFNEIIKKMIQIVPGQELAVCGPCGSNPDAVAKFIKIERKKIPEAALKKALAKENELSDISKKVKARSEARRSNQVKAKNKAKKKSS